MSLATLVFLQLLHFGNIDPHGIHLGHPFVHIPRLPFGLCSHICGWRDRDVTVALGGLFVETVHQQFLLVAHGTLQLLEGSAGHFKLHLAHWRTRG